MRTASFFNESCPWCRPKILLRCSIIILRYARATSLFNGAKFALMMLFQWVLPVMFRATDSQLASDIKLKDTICS